MQVDYSKCTGCLRCVDYCPVSAIAKIPNQRLVEIDQDECVECTVCYRAQVCAADALAPTELTWPRILRGNFSDPKTEHKETGVPGRGTEEMKTNDVTGRYGPGRVGMAAEIGRPGTGTRLYDVEKVAQAMASLGVEFEPKNPVTTIMVDKKTGKLRDDVLNEKVLSAIVEFDADISQVPEVLAKMKEVAGQIETVFSLDIISLVDHTDGHNPLDDIGLAELGAPPLLLGKTNVGMGKPRAKNLEGLTNDTY